MLNVMIKNCFKSMNLIEIGRSSKFYNQKDTYVVKNFPLIIMLGFAASIQSLQKGIMVNIDYSSRVLRSDSVCEFMQQMKQKKTQQAIKDALIGKVVLAYYGNFRMYRIDDIDFSSNPTTVWRPASQGNPAMNYI